MNLQSSATIELERFPPILPTTHQSAARTRLLCATDLSPGSRRAVGRAMDLSKQLNAQLTLLHVIPRAGSAQDFRYARDEVSRQVGLVGRPARGEPEILVQSGNHVDVITTAVKETDVDLIVLGGQRRNALTPLIGTTAERVVALTGRPTLVVNAQPDRPYVGVVIAAELTASFVDVIRAASSLKLLDGARVSVVHGFEFPRGPLFAIDARATLRHLEEWEKAAKARLLRNLDAAGVESSRVRIVFHQAGPSPIRAIHKVIRSAKADLLIIGSKSRSSLNRALSGSVADSALRSVDCDILVAARGVDSRAEDFDRQPYADARGGAGYA